MPLPASRMFAFLFYPQQFSFISRRVQEFSTPLLRNLLVDGVLGRMGHHLEFPMRCFIYTLQCLQVTASLTPFSIAICLELCWFQPCFSHSLRQISCKVLALFDISLLNSYPKACVLRFDMIKKNKGVSSLNFRLKHKKYNW